MNAQPPAIYEDEHFIELCGGALRPGGLQLTLEAVRKAGLAPGARLLDVCCGLGESVAYLARQGYLAAGIDASAKLVARGRALGREIREGDACNLQGAYDGLLYECALSLLADKPRALRAAAACLRPGGLLIVSDLYPRAAGQGSLTVPCLTCLNGVIPRADLEREMAAAGFEQVLWEDKTELYKQFVAALIMEYGSVAAFFGQFISDCSLPGTLEAVRSVKLGYFMSIWRKHGND